MSIDNITVQEWNKMGYKTVDDEDNEPNHHPRFSEEAMSKTYDPVNRPEHYNTGGLECIDAIRVWRLNDISVRRQPLFYVLINCLYSLSKLLKTNNKMIFSRGAAPIGPRATESTRSAK